MNTDQTGVEGQHQVLAGYMKLKIRMMAMVLSLPIRITAPVTILMAEMAEEEGSHPVHPEKILQIQKILHLDRLRLDHHHLRVRDPMEASDLDINTKRRGSHSRRRHGREGRRNGQLINMERLNVEVDRSHEEISSKI